MGYGSKHVEIGDGGPRPRDKGTRVLRFSRPVSKLTTGPRCASSVGPGTIIAWPVPNMGLPLPA